MKKSKLMVLAVLTMVLSLVLVVTVTADCPCPPEPPCTPEPPCPPEPPPCGDEGCTPGYWKQPHHFGSWEGYAPDDSFEGVFGDTWADLCYDGKKADDGTLLAALEARGPGSELCRHGVAALLNAASGDVAYMWTVDEVLAAVEAGNAGALVMANERYCPLGRNP